MSLGEYLQIIKYREKREGGQNSLAKIYEMAAADLPPKKIWKGWVANGTVKANLRVHCRLYRKVHPMIHPIELTVYLLILFIINLCLFFFRF